MMKNVMLITVLLFASFSIQAQHREEFQDSIPYKRNVIKWNVTPFLLWSYKNINLSYERILKPHRSFSVNAGYFELPQFTKNLFDSLRVENTTKRAGFSLSGDYRFYFKKRNKKLAPDGLYWGVFGSYHYTRFDNNITVLKTNALDADLLFGAQLNILGVGVELGYQFVIKERLTIDLIFMGPSISMYTNKLTLGGQFDANEEDEYLQAIYDVLKNTIPGFEQLVNDGEVTASGANISLGMGLRYMIQIGYRF